MKRIIRRILESALPVSGMGIIFLSVLFGSDSLQRQVLFVLFGILILEAGACGLASRLLPDERRYLRPACRSGSLHRPDPGPQRARRRETGPRGKQGRRGTFSRNS